MSTPNESTARGYTEEDYKLVLNACRNLPPAIGNYLINDYIANLLLTVLDLQLHTTTVVRAMDYFSKNAHDDVNTHDQLKSLFGQYPDTREGNIALALRIWGYRYGDRAGRLRRLVEFFEARGVTDQSSLNKWSLTADIKDFEGRVKGLGYAAFQWLLMRQGRETIKTDLHINRFVASTLGRPLANQINVAILERVARELEIKAYELDWRIWEQGRKGQQTIPSGS